jgi:peptide/nickel transport system substrate-binding protein
MRVPIRGVTRRRAVAVAVAAVLAVGLIWGLAGALATSSSPSPAGKVVLKLGMTNIPDNLNPFVGQLSSCYEIWSLNYDLMVGFDAGTYEHSQGTAATGLADRWTVSDGGKTWTFHIRPGVKWQDGVPLTAKDVAFTYNYIVKNDLSNYTLYTNFVKYPVEAPDNETVVFHCTKPKANMLNMWVYIVPEHLWSSVTGKAAGGSYPVNPPIIGSGPFQLTDYKKSSYAIMTANKNYWAGAPKIDEVDFVYYQNADTMTQDLKANTIQAAWGVLEAQYRSLQNDATLKPLAYIDPELDNLVFNCYDRGPSQGNPVLKDWHFRQALQYAVDHNELVRIAYGGLAQPATSVLVSNFWTDPDWHWEPPADLKYTFDLTKAGDALTAAGYPLKSGVRVDKQGKPISLRLWTRTDSASGQSAGKLIAGWFKKLGLKITLAVMDDGALNDAIYATKGSTFDPNFDLIVWGWGGDPDPNFIMSVFTTDQINSWSDSAFSDPQYDKLFLEQQTTIDPTARRAIIDQMQQLIYQKTPYIPTVYPKSVEAYNYSGWTGWVSTPAKGGGVFFTSPVVASYMTVHPVSGAATTSSSSKVVLIGVIVGIVIVIIVIAVVMALRGRGKAVEESA